MEDVNVAKDEEEKLCGGESDTDDDTVDDTEDEKDDRSTYERMMDSEALPRSEKVGLNESVEEFMKGLDENKDVLRRR